MKSDECFLFRVYQDNGMDGFKSFKALLIIFLALGFVSTATAQNSPYWLSLNQQVAELQATHSTLQQVLLAGNSTGANGINMQGNPIVNLQNPNDPQDAVTKSYVDALDTSGSNEIQTLGEVMQQGNDASTNLDMNGTSLLDSQGTVNVNGQLQSSGDAVFEGSRVQINDPSSPFNPRLQLAESGSTMSQLEWTGSSTAIQDMQNNRYLLKAFNSGKVEILQGNLDMMGNSMVFDSVNGAAQPGGTGVIFAHEASDPNFGDSIRWSDGTLGNTAGLYMDSGLYYQGSSTHPSFYVRDVTGDGTKGAKVFEVNNGGSATVDSYGNLDLNSNNINNANNVFASQVEVGSGDARLQVVDSGAISYIAPYDDGSFQNTRELGYDTSTNQWFVENGLEAKDGVTTTGGFSSSDNYLQGNTLSVSNIDDGSGGEIDAQSRINLNSNDIVGVNSASVNTLTVSNRINMQQNQIDNMVIDTRSSDPASPAVGQIWYRTDLD